MANEQTNSAEAIAQVVAEAARVAVQARVWLEQKTAQGMKEHKNAGPQIGQTPDETAHIQLGKQRINTMNSKTPD